MLTFRPFYELVAGLAQGAHCIVTVTVRQVHRDALNCHTELVEASNGRGDISDFLRVHQV